MPGVRAVRKQQTRERIAAVAMELFAARGFDAVSVAEVARAAGVTEKTVFNHYATKEDLVYSGDRAFEAALLAAVSGRPPGESAHAAVTAFLLDRYRGFVGDPAREARQLTLARLLADSPALQARERQILARYAAALRAQLTREHPTDDDDLRPQVAADALIAAHSAVVGAFRRAALAGRAPEEFAPRVLASARAAFDLLARGLAPGRPG